MFVSRYEQRGKEDMLSVGAIPRSGLMLLMAAKSLACLDGRHYVHSR